MSILNIIAGAANGLYTILKQFGYGMPIVAGVPIQAYKYSVKQNAQVSKHVLVDLTQGKKLVSDNVAPGPREWQIEGYLGGFPVGSAGPITSISSFADLGSFALGVAGELVGRAELMPSIKNAVAKLDNAYGSRAPVDYIDSDAKTWTLLGNNPVVIESLEFEKVPDINNRITVRLTLLELNILSVTAVGSDVATNALPQIGGLDGSTMPGPSATAQTVTLDSPILDLPDPSVQPLITRLRAGLLEPR